MNMHCYGRLALGALCILLCVGFQTNLHAQRRGGAERTQDSQSLNSMLSAHLRELILHDGIHAKKGERVSVRANPRTGLIVIDLGREFIPKHDPAENEEFEERLSEEVQYLLGSSFAVKEIRFLYGGKAIQTYFPALNHPRPPHVQSGLSIFRGPLVISAGHGQYYSYDHGWVAQRGEFFGIREDYITSDFADVLYRELPGSFSARSMSTAIHAPSGLPWRDVSARYYLEYLFPSFGQVWASQSPTRDDPERERIDDIYSRPYLANLLNSKALLSIHTNGGPDSARGTRVYFYPGRAQSEQLAIRVLCSMKEIIHSIKDYESWSVARTPVAQNHAENREVDPSIPSVIVEVGFHSNSEDAAIMRQPEFQSAAMRGVAKGYELAATGRECKAFEITSVPSVTAKRYSQFNVEINFDGNPREGVEAHLPDCGGGQAYGCGVIAGTESPIIVSDACTGPGTTTRRAQLEDGDGVKTPYFNYTVTCL